MIRAIGFDLWETLITDTPERSRAQERLRLTRMEEILSLRGFTATAAEIESAYRRLWTRCHELYWSRDTDIPCRVQIEHFFEALEVDVTGVDDATMIALEDAYANATVDVPPAIVAGADEVLRAVKASGYRVGLISNTGRTPGSALRQVLRFHGLDASIDAMVFSNEHGACKPQLSIFEELRAALDVSFDEILFVGDNPHADVLGAQRCGMRAVYFDPPQRGGAFARTPADHREAILADATITDLRQLLELLADRGRLAE
jgi:putative hydrolase of the HAD superfamily